MMIINSKIRLNWNDALLYASSKGMFIPSKEQAKKLKLPNCWTSTTDDKNTCKAWVNNEPLTIVKNNVLGDVVLVEKLETTQNISYQIGDVEY